MEVDKDSSDIRRPTAVVNAEDSTPYTFPVWRAFRRKHPPDSPFFASGNLERELLAKQMVLEISEEEKQHISYLEEEQQWELRCPVVGCKVKLKGLKELETHFFSRHTAVCSVCNRVFPTHRLLDLHVSETHDSFFQAKAARGHPMYKCLVEGCDMKFMNDLSRHQHLVDRHKFPRSFEFHKKKHPSQKQRTKMHQQTKLKQGHEGNINNITHDSVTEEHTETSMQVVTETSGLEAEHSEASMEVELLTSAVSRLSTSDRMPTNITFGRRHSRGFAFVRSRSRGRGKSD